MPFVVGGGGTAPPPSSSMHINPDRVVALKQKYEQVRDSIRDFLTNEGFTLRYNFFAADTVSQKAAEAFNRNTEEALDVIRLFLKELENNIEQLSEAVRTYRLAEEGNTTAMQQPGR